MSGKKKNEAKQPVIKSTQRIIRRVVKKIQIKDRKVNKTRINVFQCRSCSYKTSEKHEISSHLHKHEACSSKRDVNQQSRGYFTCYHCHFKTEQEKIIQQHLLLHNQNKLIHKMHPNSIRETESDSSATDHIEASQRYICDTCDAKYSDLHNLECHRTYAHRHEKICNICGKRFKDFKTYQEHRKIHEDCYDNP